MHTTDITKADGEGGPPPLTAAAVPAVLAARRRAVQRARWLAGYFVLTLGVVGAWQALAPDAFFTEFPGFGRNWVDTDGPYNGHLVRDVGYGNLALALVALAVVLRPHPSLVVAAGLSLVIASWPHTLYHLINVDLLPHASDEALQTMTLVTGAALAAALTAQGLILDRRGS